MASPQCLSLRPLSYPSQSAAIPSLGLRPSLGGGCVLSPLQLRARRRRSFVVGMAPEEEKMTRRSPLDFPIARNQGVRAVELSGRSTLNRHKPHPSLGWRVELDSHPSEGGRVPLGYAV